MVFNFVQLVRATWHELLRAGEGEGGPCQHFAWGLEVVYDGGA